MKWVLDPRTREPLPCPRGCATADIQPQLDRMLRAEPPRPVTFDVEFHPLVAPVAERIRQAVAHRQPLFALLVGGYGVGKSHILQAAVNLARSQKTRTASYIIWPELERALRRAVRDGQLETLEDMLMRDVHVLALDELDKGHDTDFTMSILTSILDYRYRRGRASGLVTLMAANAPLDALPGYIVSRARDAELGVLAELWDAPDMRPIVGGG